jgi:hypothetical protein
LGVLGDRACCKAIAASMETVATTERRIALDGFRPDSRDVEIEA